MVLWDCGTIHSISFLDSPFRSAGAKDRDFQRLDSVDILQMERRSPFPTKYKRFYVPGRREQRSLFPTNPWVFLGYCWVSRFPVQPNQHAAKCQHALATWVIYVQRVRDTPKSSATFSRTSASRLGLGGGCGGPSRLLGYSP